MSAVPITPTEFTRNHIQQSRISMLVDLAMQRGADGFTTLEVTRLFNCSAEAAREPIRKLKASGFIVYSHQSRQAGANQEKGISSVYVLSRFAPSLAEKYRNDIGHKEYANVFDYVMQTGHDEDYEPKPATDICKGLPGSLERIETMRRRVLRGESIWNPNDVKDGFIQKGEIRGMPFRDVPSIEISMRHEQVVCTRLARRHFGGAE